MASRALERRNRRVGIIAFIAAAAMLGMGYAAVPLYRLFCQVTGFGGTTQRATEEQAANAAEIARSAGGRIMSVRFDGSLARDMPWEFRPLQVTDTVSIGQRDMAVYVARNNSDVPITGSATFNVMPEQTGKYFHKVQCFCFTEQTLQPGQEVRMPVIYYVDPKILDDKEVQNVEQITLSYTFHKVNKEDS